MENKVVYGIIYKATGPNGKVYIGQTIQTLERRKSNHAYRSKKQDRRYAFGIALLEEGFSNFIWEQIDTAETKEELDSKEKQWIAFYDSMNSDKGYNNQDGGLHCVYSIETRKKISEARKGRKLTEEHRQKIIEANRNPSPETRKRKSEAKRGIGNGRSKLSENNVIQIKKELLNLKCNISSIAKKYGISRRTIYHIKNGSSWGFINVPV